MNTYRIYLRKCSNAERNDFWLLRTIQADRFSVYAKDKVCFFVDQHVEGWFDGHTRSEIVFELVQHDDFFVTKDGVSK